MPPCCMVSFGLNEKRWRSQAFPNGAQNIRWYNTDVQVGSDSVCVRNSRDKTNFCGTLKPRALTRVLYYACLSLTVVTTLRHVLGSEPVNCLQLRRSTGTMKRVSGGEWVHFTGACQRSVRGQRTNANRWAINVQLIKRSARITPCFAAGCEWWNVSTPPRLIKHHKVNALQVAGGATRQLQALQRT